MAALLTPFLEARSRRLPSQGRAAFPPRKSGSSRKGISKATVLIFYLSFPYFFVLP